MPLKFGSLALGFWIIDRIEAKSVEEASPAESAEIALCGMFEIIGQNVKEDVPQKDTAIPLSTDKLADSTDSYLWERSQPPQKPRVTSEFVSHMSKISL